MAKMESNKSSKKSAVPISSDLLMKKMQSGMQLQMQDMMSIMLKQIQ